MDAVGTEISSSSSTLYYPSFTPNVTMTGMATHPDCDPEPVTVRDGPIAYQVRVKIPCRARGLYQLGIGTTADRRGMYIEGLVDVSEAQPFVGELKTYPFVHRQGMRRLYASGNFSFFFRLPQEVGKPVLTGRARNDGTIKFLVPKEAADQPHEPEPGPSTSN